MGAKYFPVTTNKHRKTDHAVGRGLLDLYAFDQGDVFIIKTRTRWVPLLTDPNKGIPELPLAPFQD